MPYVRNTIALNGVYYNFYSIIFVPVCVLAPLREHNGGDLEKESAYSTVIRIWPSQTLFLRTACVALCVIADEMARGEYGTDSESKVSEIISCFLT